MTSLPKLVFPGQITLSDINDLLELILPYFILLIILLFILLAIFVFGAVVLNIYREITAKPKASATESSSPAGIRSEKVSQENSLPIPPPLHAADHNNDDKFHLLLCATGSVATIKIPLIVHHLLTVSASPATLSIRLVLTPSATRFLAGQSGEQPALAELARTPGVDAIYTDVDEWRVPWTRGAPILHIELRRWADLMVVAPLSAHSMAMLAGGQSSGLVSSVARAWDATGLIDVPRTVRGQVQPRRKRIIVAPAMNTAMWEHPATAQHLRVLEQDWGVTRHDGSGDGTEQDSGWIEVLRPVEKNLACGDTGSGAMREWKEIARVIEARLGLGGNKPGSTREGIAKHGDRSTANEDQFLLVDRPTTT